VALVFSAGGMFGAWQAGAWARLSELFRPDLVVGVSVGALNAWVAAAAAGPKVLIDRWLNLEGFERPRWRLPKRPLDGLIDVSNLEAVVRETWASLRPMISIGIATTELPRLRPRLHRDGEISWRHLMASCAVLGLLPQQRLNGGLHSDGGLLNAVPVWAAIQMGATHAVAINVMPRMPAVIRLPLLGLRRLRGDAVRAPAVPMYVVSPKSRLGGWREISCWSGDLAARWIEDGYWTVDRESACIKHFLCDTF
jgi:NTE family protein